MTDRPEVGDEEATDDLPIGYPLVAGEPQTPAGAKPDPVPPPGSLPDPGGAGGTTQALASLLKLAPFTDLHRKMTAQPTPSAHPCWEQVCIFADFVFRLLTVALLLAILAGVAWKTLAPFPDFSR